jgi:hypothetical protein
VYPKPRGREGEDVYLGHFRFMYIVFLLWRLPVPRRVLRPKVQDAPIGTSIWQLDGRLIPLLMATLPTVVDGSPRFCHQDNLGWQGPIDTACWHDYCTWGDDIQFRAHGGSTTLEPERTAEKTNQAENFSPAWEKISIVGQYHTSPQPL